MSKDDEPQGEPFVHRWSRRKVEADKPAATAALPSSNEATAAIVGQPPPPGEVSAPSSADDDVPEVPDLENLTAESDFSAFMQDGVPDETRRLALRKLWRLDPVFANLDGLVDYGENFTDAATVVDNLKTAYEVGRGMLGEEEELEDETENALAAEPLVEETESPEMRKEKQPKTVESDGLDDRES